MISKKTYFLFLIPVFVLFSCGGAKTITDRNNIPEQSSKKIVKAHTKNNFNQKTLSADLKLNYKKGNQSQNISLKLRMEKDKTIWLSGSYFGFPVLKAIITPNRVSYYVKITKTYYDGDFTSLSKLLGTEVNFDMLQNILLGDAVFELNPKELTAKVNNNAYLLTAIENSLDNMFYWVHPLNYKIEKQKITNPIEKQKLSLFYKEYQTVEGVDIPKNLEITASKANENILIEIDYKSVELNKELTFPYSIPTGYKN